jgi:putative colanic acid biosynthesis acetyltransferase WcaF
MNQDDPSSNYRGVRLDLFSTAEFDRGASRSKEIAWYFIKVWFFLSPWPWPNRLKRRLLTLFGAKVGKGLYMRPRVNIHMPWKLTIGDFCQIGDAADLLNMEPITIGDHVTIGHQAYLAAASHDPRSKTFKYANKPIVIEDGVWIATRAFIGAGVTIGENSVVGACATVLKSVPPDSFVGTSLGQVIGKRELINP